MEKATENQEFISLEKTETNTIVVEVTYNLPSLEKATAIMKYTFYENGIINVKTTVNNLADHLPFLPRFGNNFILKNDFESGNWLGKEPFENYQDRNTAANIGDYKASVADLYFPYIRPQENGYKTENRWVTFTNAEGLGIKITAPKYFEFNAHHQYNSDFDAGEKKMQRQTTDIKKRDFVNINIDN